MDVNVTCEGPGTPDEEVYVPGDVIANKYLLLRKVGEGAMGTVWLALNTALDLRVAIKLLHSRYAGTSVSTRLLREAQLTAKLRHPAVVRVFDYGQTFRREPYLVMELLHGEALRELLIRNGRVSAERAVQMLLPVASGIEAAHAHGIVHRDLKPENIMLTREDGGLPQPKVLDFGIAKIHWPEERTGITGHCVVGTPEYMSPEQALGLDEVDHRADVWSFCVMLYEMVSGETPFARDDLMKTLIAVGEAQAPSLVDKAGIDEALWSIVERGLRKAPCERWASMHELGQALARWLLSRDIRDDVSGVSLHAEWLLPENPGPALSERPAVPIALAHSDRGRALGRRRGAHAAGVGVLAVLIGALGFGTWRWDAANASTSSGLIAADPPPGAASAVPVVALARSAAVAQCSGEASGAATSPVHLRATRAPAAKRPAPKGSVQAAAAWAEAMPAPTAAPPKRPPTQPRYKPLFELPEEKNSDE